jgi:hypothetical protein
MNEVRSIDLATDATGFAGGIMAYGLGFPTTVVSLGLRWRW